MSHGGIWISGIPVDLHAGFLPVCLRHKSTCQRKVLLLASFWVLAVSMADREERRFAEVSRESVKLVAEGAGVELGDDVAALLAEDVCYRLREATQVSAAVHSFIPPYIVCLRRTYPHHYVVSPLFPNGSVTCNVDGMLFWSNTEQLSVYETCQEEEADSGGLQQSSALE